MMKRTSRRSKVPADAAVARLPSPDDLQNAHRIGIAAGIERARREAERQRLLGLIAKLQATPRPVPAIIITMDDILLLAALAKMQLVQDKDLGP